MSLALLALLSLGSPNSAEPQRVVVPNFEAQGVPEGLAASLTGVVLTRLEGNPTLSVLSQGDIDRLLAQEQRRQLLGCGGDGACYSEVAGVLDAGQLVWGAVGRVGERFLLTLHLLEAKEGTVVRRVTREARAEERLVEAATEAADALWLHGEAPSQRCVDCEEPERNASLALKVGNDFTTFLSDGLDVSLVAPSFDLDFAYRVYERLALTFSAGVSFGSGTRDTSAGSRKVSFQVIPVALGARYYFAKLTPQTALYTGLQLGAGFVRTAVSGDEDLVSSFAAELEAGMLYTLAPRWSFLAELTYGLTPSTPRAVREAPLNAATVNLGLAFAF